METKISCDRAHREYDICLINGPTLLDPAASTLFAVGPTQPKYFVEKIRPHPRKWQPQVMSQTKEVTLRAGPAAPKTCDVVHNATAIVFSAGGYIGHFFHDFNDGLIPLFITTVQTMSLSNQDVVLVIGKLEDSWVSKYGDLLGEVSKHPIVNLDKDTNTHCFNSAVVGLVYHGFLTINPKLMPGPTTLVHFHNLLDKVYGQARQLIHHPHARPKMVLLVRKGHVGRVLLNQDHVRAMAEDVGFDTTVFEPKVDIPVAESYGLLSRSHVVVGVHGAAMTHLLFLRPGTVLIQVVPIGLDLMSEICYGKPAKEMGLEYMEYKIGVEESSLIDKYERGNPIFKESLKLQKKSWGFVKVIYMKQQNVTLDLNRFRGYLETAYRKAKILMDKQGSSRLY